MKASAVSRRSNYWNEAGIERFEFLGKLMEVLDRDQWQASSDSGWDEFDITIFGDRFTKVVVNTVAENHGGNKRLLRARLSGHWTLLGQVFFWAVVALVAVVIFVTKHNPWSSLTGILLLLTVGYLHLRTRRTIRLGIALMDLTAQEIKLTKLNAPKKFVKPD